MKHVVAVWICVAMVLIASKSHADEMDIVRVNNFWNTTIQPKEDRAVHGKDHWQSPAETWKRKTGDCDDYVIAKYYTLLSLGIPTSALTIANVFHEYQGDISLHLVLLYANKDGTWVLDNISPDVQLLQERWDIRRVLASYDAKGVKWHSARPPITNTPAMWSAMRANQAKHIADAKAAYNSRRAVVASIR